MASRLLKESLHASHLI